MKELIYKSVFVYIGNSIGIVEKFYQVVQCCWIKVFFKDCFQAFKYFSPANVLGEIISAFYCPKYASLCSQWQVRQLVSRWTSNHFHGSGFQHTLCYRTLAWGIKYLTVISPSSILEECITFSYYPLFIALQPISGPLSLVL